MPALRFAASVGEVGDVALHQRLVLGVERQAPDQLAGLAGRLLDLAGQRVVVGDHRGVGRPSATSTAPVRVAMSTIRSAPSSTA